MTTTALLQCPRCAWWTYRLEPAGTCLDCTLGWTTCAEHVRLEWAGSEHRRVTVYEVTRALREHQSPPTISAGSRGARGPG